MHNSAIFHNPRAPMRSEKGIANFFLILSLFVLIGGAFLLSLQSDLGDVNVPIWATLCTVRGEKGKTSRGSFSSLLYVIQ